MGIVAGTIKELSFEHNEFGSRTFECKSGEDAGFMPGGFKNNDDDGNIGGNGTRIIQLDRYPWSLEVTILAKPGDLVYLQNVSQSPEEATITVTFADNDVKSGTGQPVGDLQENKQTAVMSLKIAGSGTFDSI